MYLNTPSLGGAWGGLYVISKLNSLFLHQPQPAVDDGLVQFKVGDAIAQQAAGGFVLLEDGDGVAELVEVVGTGEAGGAGADDGDADGTETRRRTGGHGGCKGRTGGRDGDDPGDRTAGHTGLHEAAGRDAGLDEAFAEGGLGDGGLVLAIGSWLVVKAVQDAGLLAQGGTDAAGELWEGVSAVEQAVGQLPVAFVQGIVPLGGLVAQRTGPMAEGHATVHTAAGLEFAFAGVERLLHLAKIVDSIVNRTVSRLLAVYL